MAKSLESLLRELHDLVRSIDGLHAGDALDELCKVLHGRLVEEGAITETEGPFAEPVRLSDAARQAIDRKLGRRRLGTGGSDLRGRAFQRMLAPAIRAGMGQYFTPEAVVRFVVDVVRPRRTESVLDPFAGSGRFLAACRQSAIRGIEKSERMARVAGVDFRLRGVDPGGLLCADALLPFERLDMSPESFDVVLTNPPFGSLLGREALARLGRFDLAEGRRAVPLEVLGLERCVRFLRPGGRLGIVLPEGVLGNRNTRHVRAWAAERLCVRAIVSLPLETFAPYGAGVKTCVLIARRWRADETPGAGHEVCLVRVGAVGYDAAGRARDADDLPEAVATVRTFLDDRVTSGGGEVRSRVVPFSRLLERGAWTVEGFLGPPVARSRTSHPVSVLADLVDERREFVTPADTPDAPVAYVGLEHVEGTTGDLIRFALRRGAEIRSRSKVFRRGDVLYGRLRAYLNKVYLAEGDVTDGVCSCEFHVLVPRTDRVRPLFLRTLLASRYVADVVGSLLTGSTHPRLSRSDLLAISVPVPPLAKQDALVRFVRRESARRRKLRAEAESLGPAILDEVVDCLEDGRGPSASGSCSRPDPPRTA